MTLHGCPWLCMAVHTSSWLCTLGARFCITMCDCLLTTSLVPGFASSHMAVHTEHTLLPDAACSVHSLCAGLCTLLHSCAPLHAAVHAFCTSCALFVHGFAPCTVLHARCTLCGSVVHSTARLCKTLHACPQLCMHGAHFAHPCCMVLHGCARLLVLSA